MPPIPLSNRVLVFAIHAFAAGGASLLLGAVLGGCSSPELALEDLQSMHELEVVEVDGAPSQPRLAYKSSAELYGGSDRLWYSLGLQHLGSFFGGWIQPSAQTIEDPELLAVDLLLELEGMDSDNTVLVCRSLRVVGGFLLYETSALVRRRCAALLGRLGEDIQEVEPPEGWLALSSDAVVLRFGEITKQLRKDLEERLLTYNAGSELPAEMVKRHLKPIHELARLQGGARISTQKLLAALADLISETRVESLRDALVRSSRALAADLIRQQIGEALEQRDPSEYVRSELGAAWLRAQGIGGWQQLESWLGEDDSEEVRRSLVADLAAYDSQDLRREGALSWLARLAEDSRSGSSRLAVRVLRLESGLGLGVGDDWRAALGLPIEGAEIEDR